MANVIRKQPKTHLIIPDSHAHPDFHNKRFNWLGKLILDVKPDVVVNIGDMADMVSLCSYEKGKRSAELNRYVKDIEASRDADERIWTPIKAAKKKLPRRVFTLGNHENRIDRATQETPELHGKLSMSDLDLDHNWEVYPFLEPANIDGVCYSHYFTSGSMGRPIGGENPAATLIKKNLISSTQGHGHIRDFAERTDANGRKTLGLEVGCYQDYWADYAGPANKMWWRGIVVKHGVEDGHYDPEFIGIDRLKKEYSK